MTLSQSMARDAPARTDAQRDGYSWFTVFEPRPAAEIKLFCFPYAGGQAHLFRSWHQSLPRDVETYASNLPGRAYSLNRPPFRRVADLVAEVGPALVREITGPFVLFGHSLGAILAFEVARWLRSRHGLSPALLAVAAHRAPQVANADDAPMHLMNDRDFVVSLAKLKGTTPEVLASPEILRFMIPILRADFEMAETYRYTSEPSLSCPIAAFGGTDDEETAGGKLEAWRDQTTDACLCQLVKGDHFFVRSNERMFLELLRHELSGLRRGHADERSRTPAL